MSSQQQQIASPFQFPADAFQFGASSSPPPKQKKTGNRKREAQVAVSNSALLDAINSSHQESHAKLDKLMAEQSAIAFDVSTLKSINEKIKTDVSSNSNAIKILQSTQSDLSVRVNEMEQKALKLHMDICGLKSDQIAHHQNLKELVTALLGSYKIQHSSSDIEKVFLRNIKRNNHTVPILTVIFTNVDEKLHIMRSKRQLDPKNEQKIFFSHSLTPYNRRLYAKAREVGRELKIPYVFITDGHVILKKGNEPRGTCIRTIEELESFKVSFTPPSQPTSLNNNSNINGNVNDNSIFLANNNSNDGSKGDQPQNAM